MSDAVGHGLWCRPRSSPQHHAVPPRAQSHPYLVKFGQRVRELRRERGWTQEDLEAKAKGERVYLSRLEGGKQNPSILSVRALARAFKISIPALLPPER